MLAAAELSPEAVLELLLSVEVDIAELSADEVAELSVDVDIAELSAAVEVAVLSDVLVEVELAQAVIAMAARTATNVVERNRMNTLL